MIEAFFKSGQVAYLILGVMLLEWLVFAKVFRHSSALLWGLGAGACLVLALWAALTGQTAAVIGAFLVLSFICHLMEVRQWRSLAKRLPQ